MPLYTLTPQDVLFFRDGRPMEAAGGHGARWPEPSLIFDAIHAALHRAFPAPSPENFQVWEHPHRFGRSSDRDNNRLANQRFGSLTTAGLFPVLPGDGWLFPAPQDVVLSPRSSLELLHPLSGEQGENNLRRPLKYPLANPCQPSKEETPPWWSRAAYCDYLTGRKPPVLQLKRNSDLFAGEWTTGIGIDPNTQTQDGERIYSAEYLRLRPETALGFSATLPVKQNGSREDGRDCIGELFLQSRTLIVGGQQRVCSIEPLNEGQTLATVLPVGGSVTGTRVKWVLLTPAIFPMIPEDPEKAIPSHPGGWLPNWIDNTTGRVKLKLRAGSIRRVWDEESQRSVRRSESESEIEAWLVAARIPKPVPVVGWTERLHLVADEASRWREGDQKPHGPRATHLAVPAGAVYYFESRTVPDAEKLAAALNWHGNATNAIAIKNRRSALLGEKGFGLGVCGTWKFHGE